MSWDYDPSHSSTRDWIRWRVGDTVESDQLQSNEEIAAALAENGNKYKAAIAVCKAIAAVFARRVRKAVGPLRIDAQQQYEHYVQLARDLQMEMGRRVAAYAGGINQDDMESVEKDTDREKPAFKTGQHDIEGTGEDVDDLADSWS